MCTSTTPPEMNSGKKNSYYYSQQQMGIDRRTKKLIVDRCAPFIKGEYILDLGYVDGLWTDVLEPKGFNIDIVEGAIEHCEYARKKYHQNTKIKVHHTLFEEYVPTQKYDTIIAGDMIRYLANPIDFLNKIQSWLTDNGILIVTVPNSRSLHRRIGALMNLETTPTSANQRDIEVGNLRSYDRYEFRNLLLSSGYKISALHGCFLKPLSSQQIESWTDDMLNAWLLLGDELEDYAWFLYAICKVQKPT